MKIESITIDGVLYDVKEFSNYNGEDTCICCSLSKDGECLIGNRCFLNTDEYFELRDKPLRNCDVGMPKDQTIRFHSFCLEHSSNNVNCLDCPLCKKKGQCEFVWGQLPYDKEGEK